MRQDETSSNAHFDPMNSYTPIGNAVEKLAHGIDWHHSFIRECYFVSRHCVYRERDSSGTLHLGDVGGPLNARLFIAFPSDPAVSGIEFLCKNVSSFNINNLEENFVFAYEYDRHSGGRLSLVDPDMNQGCTIHAESILVRFLGDEYNGMNQFAGFELPTEDAVEATTFEGCWRRCEGCKNIWEESPKLTFSRCPDCGNVTRLKR